MSRKLASIAILASLILLTAAPLAAKPRKKQPKKVTVVHILIGFKKTVPGKEQARTKKQAEELAYELLDRAEAGEDFLEMIKEYSDDYKPQRGVMALSMSQFDEPIMTGVFPRRDMAANFGQVSFDLEVGEFGIARYHPGNSPIGYHIIKRIE